MMFDIHGKKLTTHGYNKFVFIGLIICSAIFIAIGIFLSDTYEYANLKRGSWRWYLFYC